jgi:hypothetical protein
MRHVMRASGPPSSRLRPFRTFRGPACSGHPGRSIIRSRAVRAVLLAVNSRETAPVRLLAVRRRRELIVVRLMRYNATVGSVRFVVTRRGTFKGRIDALLVNPERKRACFR